MPTTAIDAPADLLARLRTHRTIGEAPEAELEWLVAHGTFRRYEIGEMPIRHTEKVERLSILLTGHLAIYVDRGSGPRKIMEWGDGDVSGLLPYSRMIYPPGDTVVEETMDALELPKSCFGELARECPVVTSTLVHVMVDRARHFTSAQLQDEKMLSLGKLAAGLAHELNNPAAAAARGAKLLGAALGDADAAAHALGAAHLTPEQHSCLENLRNRSLIPPTTGMYSVLERSDREDEIAAWLERHGTDESAAATLADSGIEVEDLDEIVTILGEELVEPAVRWIAAGYASRTLARDVERATERISKLVSAVKRFTYMDRDTITVASPASLAEGLQDSLTMLGAKSRAKSANVRFDLPPDLPLIPAFGGELNQVWSNLIDNAIDAVAPGGQIVVSARREGDFVVVSVVDDGPGIPAEVASRIFDPFFTTKPVGQGTGLGLDLSRRIVERHKGDISVSSVPGRTEFRVALPVSGARREG